MSIESQMKAVIKSRSSNFYDQFSDLFEDDESRFTRILDPEFDFEEGSDEEKIYNKRIARLKAFSAQMNSVSNMYYTDDESSEWFGFTYEEIIGMANNGTVIPQEILDWAYAMMEANPIDSSLESEGTNDAHALYLELKSNPFLNIKTITQVFVNKCEDKTDELEAFLEEIDPIEVEMKEASEKAEDEKKRALQDIKSIVDEWKALQRKVDNGETLTENEQNRLEELQGIFADKDTEYQENVRENTRNFTEIKDKLATVQTKAEIAYDFGTETVEVAKELADYESTHKSSSLFGSVVGGGIAGVLGISSSSGSKCFSKTAHTIGMDTQYFAEDVQTTIHDVELLMQATADTAGFDLENSTYQVQSLTEDESLQLLGLNPTATTSNSSTTVDGTNPDGTNPDGTDPTDEPTDEPTEEPPATEPAPTGEPTDEPTGEDTVDDEESDEEMQQEGQKALTEVNAKTLSLPRLQKLIKDEGVDSQDKGEQAVELIDKLKVQSNMVDQKEEEVDAKNDAVTDASESGEPDGEAAITAAQDDADSSLEELNSAEEDEQLTVAGLKKTFKQFEKANKKYTKDTKYSDEQMKDCLELGTFTAISGGTLTAVGELNIIDGTALVASGWWNPAAVALGLYMIDMGTIEIGLGGTMIAGGTALSAFAVAGLVIDEKTFEQLDISGENITESKESLDEIERIQKESVEGDTGVDEDDDEENGDEEEEEDDDLSNDMSLLDTMYSGLETVPPQMVKAIKEGNVSSGLGKANVEMLTGLEKDTPSLIETTIAFQQQQTAQEAQEAADPSENADQGAVQDPAEIYEGYREDYRADLLTNQDYRTDLAAINVDAKTNLDYGFAGTKAGTARVALGTEEIALGTMLVAQWWNPAAIALGIALIAKGTEDTALGTEMLTVGLALTVVSTATIAADEIADSKVDESDQKTNESMDRVDEIEAEINEAVRAQLESEGGGKDMSQMSTIELLTLIIMNGINSSVLAEENQEILEEVRGQFPDIIEGVKEQILNGGTVTGGAAEAGEGEEDVEAADGEEGGEEGEDGEEGNDDDSTVFTSYKTDFTTDLETNERYSAEIKQAQDLSPILKSNFFNGAPIDKANTSIETSNELTSAALDEVNDMENQYKQAIEEAKAEKEAQEQALANSGTLDAGDFPEATVVKAQSVGNGAIMADGTVVAGDEDGIDEGEDPVALVVNGEIVSASSSSSQSTDVVEVTEETEYEAEGVYVPEYTDYKVKFGRLVDYEDGDPDIDQDKDAEDETKDAEKDSKKLEKKEAKQDKKLKKEEKKEDKLTKEIEQNQEEIEKQDEVIEEAETLAEEQTQEGEEAQETEVEPEDAESAGAEAENQNTEASNLSSEVEDIVAETTAMTEETKNESAKATAENQSIVGEMNTIGTQLQQDNTKMKSLNTQIKQEEKKESEGSSKPEPAPAAPPQPAPEPEPAPEPVQKPQKTNKKKEEEEETEPEPEPTTVPVQTVQPAPQPTEPEEPEAPEGSDKTEYASDKNKAPDLVGFVAQSDSLASGRVLTSSSSNSTSTSTTTTNSTNTNNNNTNTTKATTTQKKKSSSNSSTKKEDEEDTATQPAPVKAAQRTTQKAFDISQMDNNGTTTTNADGTKTKTMRANMRSIQAASFNKQARLNALQIRATNNVAARIAAEAKAQAEAARKQRLAQEKQERIAKIKEYASYVQMLGGVVNMAGMITSAVGKAKTATGAFIQVTAQENMVKTAAEILAAEGKQVTGEATITIGKATMTIGATETAVGSSEEAAGGATTSAGVATQTAGTTTISVSTPLCCFPTTPAGTAGVAAGTTTFVAGTSTEAAGIATTTVGITTQATGAATEAEGAATTAEGGVITAESAAELVAGNAEMAVLEGTMAIGMEQEASGMALSATGATIQAIGAYTLAAGAVTSAGADIANGNILGGIASIVGAAASVVGVSVPVSQLGNAAIQVASQGVMLAGQLATMNAGQDNSSSNNNNKKKKQFQENSRTRGIVQKTANKRQAVQNRYSK